MRAGHDPQAVIAMNHSKSTVYKVHQAMKKELKNLGKHPGTKPQTTPHTSLKTEPPTEPPPLQTRIIPKVTSEVSIGEILIEPEDWRVNQFGALLILDTLGESRRKFSYGGTVGEFICDCINIIRKLMGLDMSVPNYLWKEDDNGRRPQGEGSAVLEEVRADADRTGGETA